MKTKNLQKGAIIVSLEEIKLACKQLFERDYPEIECAYLFGSYARGDANDKSDIDLLVVCPPIGMKLYGISAELEEKLHKKIDLHTHRQLLDNEHLLSEILKEGIKIYCSNII